MEQVIFNPIFWVILFLAAICSLLASMLGTAQAREKYFEEHFEEYYEKWHKLNKHACEAYWILKHNYYGDQKYRTLDDAFFELDHYYGGPDEDEQEQRFNSERDKGE